MASAKSVSTSAQKLDALITQMKNTVKQYKNAPEQDKPKFVSALKQMNMKKRQLEQEVEQSIASLDHDAELKVTADMEEMKSLLHGLVINEMKNLNEGAAEDHFQLEAKTLLKKAQYFESMLQSNADTSVRNIKTSNLGRAMLARTQQFIQGLQILIKQL